MSLKKELLIALMGMVSLASAQEVVTLGTFGFTKDTSAVAGIHLSGMQFYNGTNNTPDTLYSTNLPLNSVVHAWNGSTYDSSTYKSVFVSGSGFVIKWTSDPELAQGQAYWVEAPSAMDAVLSGTVPMDDAITNAIVTGLQLCSFPYPVDRVITNLGFSPSINDVVHVWNGTTYDSSTYKSVFVSGSGFVLKWTDETLPITIGEGFWYESGANIPWIALRPYPTN